MKVSLIALSASLTLAMPSSALAQAQCTDTWKTHTGGGYEGGCDPYRVPWSTNWAVGTTTVCRDDAWNQQARASGSIEVGISIDCTGQPPAPACQPPSNIAPTYQGVIGGTTARFRLQLNNLLFQNGICVAGPQQVDTEDLPAGECQGTFCCGLQGVCVAAGRQWNPGCTCSVPDPCGYAGCYLAWFYDGVLRV
jgi:hypothetical protein